jgi:hypothetical protein
VYGAITLYRANFQWLPLCLMLKLAAVPISLATTLGISVDFFSCSYLDVSVRHVRLATLCIQVAIPLRVGFPIRKSADQSVFARSPQLIASYYVLHRL